MLRKRIVSFVAFMVIIGISLCTVYRILSFKYVDGILGLKYLYEQDEDTIDLLVLGSSHAFEDINTAVLYDKYGISSYVLAGSVQPFWNSYFYLLEALAYQKPQMVILEGYAAVQDFEYSDHSRIIKNNLGIRNIDSRIKSIVVSSPAEKIDDYIFSYRLWHSRYEEINESDFSSLYHKPIYEYYKGFGINFDTVACEQPEVDEFKGIKQINQKEELYFRKIIELCKQEGIPVMVVISPYVLKEEEQQKYNYLEKVAGEYQIPFMNYNDEDEYSRIGIDFGRDMADTGHLNYLGNIKFTTVLSEDIYQHMQLSDHRGDEKYDSWEKNSKDIHARIADFEVTAANDGNALIEAFDKRNHLVYLYTISNTTEICENTDLFREMGIDVGLLKDGELYILSDSIYRKISGEGIQWEYEQSIDGKWLSIKNHISIRDDKIVNESLLFYDGVQYVDEQNGIYLFIYDRFTRNFVGVKQIRIENEIVTMSSK